MLAGWLDPGRRQPAAIARSVGLGAASSDPAAARHAGVAGRIRPPAKRQGDAAGGDHPGVRRDRRRRADDPRVDGPAVAGRRTSKNGSNRSARRSGAAARRRRRRAGRLAQSCCHALAEQPLLYVALARGGNPQRIVAARSIQCVLRRFSGCLPRLGLLTETCQLLETAHSMEMTHPVGPGGVTEFDRVFEIACKAATQCLAISSADWRDRGAKPDRGGCRENAVASQNARADNLLRPLPARSAVSPARPTPD